MPADIFSEWNRMADDGRLAKVLFYENLRQLIVSTGISSVDSANSYNRVGHTIASLVFQLFGVIENSVTTIHHAGGNRVNKILPTDSLW